MTTKTKFKNDAFAAIHASASALHKINAISKTVMSNFDTECLAIPVEIKPQHIVGETNATS